MERYNDALYEFNKALIRNPHNETALGYIDQISSITHKELREKVIAKALEEAEGRKPLVEEILEEPEGLTKAKWKIKGDSQLSLGFTSQDTIWRKANSDLNEENWRILSDKAYNLRENTYDPAIFSQLRFDLDYLQEEGLGFHTKVDISPWSFIGKSQKVTIGSGGGTSDLAEIELKYWTNSKYTIGETVYTLEDGAAISLPEIKVAGGRILPTTVVTTWGANLNIPELKIHREFQPLRELWFDHSWDNLKLKLFPLGLEDLSLTSDDPLILSNRKIYWEESPWLVSWSPGHINTGAVPEDFYKGWWDDSLAFFTRDSSGVRLTNLRGLSLNFDDEDKKIDFTFSSPKDLWQDYDNFNTLESSLRPKFFWSDFLSIGGIYNFKSGFNKRDLDSQNHVGGLDLNYEINPNTEVFLETARSDSEYNKTSSYKSKKRGNTFHLSLINSSIVVFGKDYFSLNPLKAEPFYKLKLSLTHMDEGFESVLASFRETRDDCFWARHIHFRQPFKYYFTGLYEPALTWDDIKAYRIGDGIDYGRDTINLRFEFENLLEDRLDTLFDLRNVHNTNGKYIENVARLESTYKFTPKLTTKFLGLYHDLPKTKKNKDPFIFDPRSGDYYENSSVEDGKDPSLKTVSIGTKYDFFDWLNVSFIYEHTNDTTQAYDNFPRGLFNWTSFTTFDEYGKRYRKEIFGLNYEDKFPLPPYPYFDIFKFGLGIKPSENLDIYLDYTRNEYEWAQIIDDNTNHIGFEIDYNPLEKLGLYLRYAYSKPKDISELNEDSKVEKRSHHYFFFEARCRATEDSEFVGQYGVGTTAYVGLPTYTPFGGNPPVLDLQHILRLYYRRKF